MAFIPNNPFDFTRASSVADILNPKTNRIFNELHWNWEPAYARIDRGRECFYEALEAPQVNESLRDEVVDILEPRVMKLAESLFRSDIRTAEGEFTAEGLTDMFAQHAQKRTDSILDVAESSVHIARIKGKAANPLIRAIADEVTALEAYYHRRSLKSIKEALIKANERTPKPLPPKPKPKVGGHFDI